MKEFQENVAVKKPQENESLRNKMGREGIELYNNPEVK